MKKKILVIAGCSLLLASCSGKKADNPWTILYKNKTVSYYDTKDTIQSAIKKSVGEYEVPTLPFRMDDENAINICYSEDVVRYIQINSPDVVTYQNISVGDSLSKVESTFEYELKTANGYMVLFDGTEEIDQESSTDVEVENDWILITYETEEDVVSAICIYDVYYGKYVH